MAAAPGNGGSNGLDLHGRLAVLETRAGQQEQTNARFDAEIARLREFRHAAANIVNGWTEFERAVDALQRTVTELQAEVRALRTANDVEWKAGRDVWLGQLASKQSADCPAEPMDSRAW